MFKKIFSGKLGSPKFKASDGESEENSSTHSPSKPSSSSNEQGIEQHAACDQPPDDEEKSKKSKNKKKKKKKVVIIRVSTLFTSLHFPLTFITIIYSLLLKTLRNLMP